MVLIPKGGGLALTPDSDSAVLRAVRPSGGATCFKVFLCNTEHCLTHVSEACVVRSDTGPSFFFQKIGHITEILRSLLGFSLSSFCISFISLAALNKQLINQTLVIRAKIFGMAIGN